MKANEVIYHIKQDRELTQTWSHFDRTEKEEVLSKMKEQTVKDIERGLREVKTGQNWLF